MLQAGVVVTKWQQLFCLLHKTHVYRLKSRFAYQKRQESVLSSNGQCSSSTSHITRGHPTPLQSGKIYPSLPHPTTTSAVAL